MGDKFDTMQKMVGIYRELANNPIPIAGRILDGSPDKRRVVVKFSQRCLERNETILTEVLYQVTDTKPVYVVENLFSTDVTNELYSQFSPNYRYKCVVRVLPDEKQLLEIWEAGNRIKIWDLKALDLHGNICPPGEFGSLEWSSDETRVAFIAEKKREPSEPFFSPKPQNPPTGDQFPYGEQYTFSEDWGEQMNGLSETVVVVLNVNDGYFKVYPIESGYCPAQLMWDRIRDGLFIIMYSVSNRRLGMTYCTNREGHVVFWDLSEPVKIEFLTEEGVSPRCLRQRPDGIVLWVQRPSGGPHDACQAIYKYDIALQKVSEIVPVVDKEIPVNREDEGVFAGVYGNKPLAPRCFYQNSVFFTTTLYYGLKSFYASMDSGKVESFGHMEILDVFNGSVLAVESSPITFPNVVLYKVDGLTTTLTPRLIAVPNMLSSPRSITFPVADVEYDNFYLVLMEPTNTLILDCPLIVYPHGGPHSAYNSTFAIEPAFFAQLGFAVLMVNYRGSLGAGEIAVESLLGRIGSLDVNDVHKAVTAILDDHANFDSSRVAIYGGSHGGYLALQLAGQFPDVYQSVAVRNPVVDLAAMFSATDIPDWVQIESGAKYDAGILPTSGEITKMGEMSPTKWYEAYRAPTLFLCGKNDLRVPMAPCVNFYRVLRARNCKTKLHVYPDNHALSSVPVHLDALINSALWFYETLDIDRQFRIY